MIALLIMAAGAAPAALPAFMTGCWSFTDSDRWTEECWMGPKAGLMLGTSREGKGKQLKSWEQLRIQVADDGKLTLFASPGGRPPLPFQARRASAEEVEFVNESHDFPQRIAYRLDGRRLTAEISLIDGSKPIRWTYVRSPESAR